MILEQYCTLLKYVTMTTLTYSGCQTYFVKGKWTYSSVKILIPDLVNTLYDLSVIKVAVEVKNGNSEYQHLLS